MWPSDQQQYAVAFVVFSSVGGSVVGPIVGGIAQQYLAWQWCIWFQLILGVAVQLIHLILVPETRASLMMDKIAKRRRDTGQCPNTYGPTETTKLRQLFTAKQLVTTWFRPFSMFISEPIVLALSLLSGFSDALIFMFIQSFGLVYAKWNFNSIQVGLAFIPLLIGYLL